MDGKNGRIQSRTISICIDWPCEVFDHLYSFLEKLKKYGGELEHNLCKNVSNWVTFLWQKLIQMNKYGLNNNKTEKRELS